MRHTTIALAFALAVTVGMLAIAGGAAPPEAHAPAATEAGVSVWFSPDGGCTDAIVREVAQAKTAVHVQAYFFTSTPIAKALSDAMARGVKVVVVLDKSQRTDRYTVATFLLNNKVPAYIDDKHGLAHNKIMLIDGKTIITGSFNFTRAADEKNAENLLVIRDHAKLYAAYEASFQAHLKHAEKYTGPEAKPAAGEDDGR